MNNIKFAINNVTTNEVAINYKPDLFSVFLRHDCDYIIITSYKGYGAKTILIHTNASYNHICFIPSF
jgi:hypothetical protein